MKWLASVLSASGIIAIFALWTTPTGGGASILQSHYLFAHLLFGGVGPFLLGLIGRPAIIKDFSGWSILPFRLVWRLGWSLGTGMFLTLLLSIWNEMVWDPRTNHVPFTHAWHDFAADMAGMAIFLLCFAVMACLRRLRPHRRASNEQPPRHPSL